MVYWNTDKFKNKSDTNSSNRKSSIDGAGPSLHTGGSIPVSEYRRRYVKEKGVEPSDSELFLMIHKTKENKNWVDTKSKSTWDKFKVIVKRRRLNDVPEPNIDGEGHEDVDEEEEENNVDEDEAFISMASTLSKEVLDNAWVEATGGPIKGRVYGLGSESTTLMKGTGLTSCAPTSSSPVPPVPFENLLDTATFQEAVDRAVEQKLANMQASFEDKLRTIEAAMKGMQSSQPEGSLGEGGSTSHL